MTHADPTRTCTKAPRGPDSALVEEVLTGKTEAYGNIFRLHQDNAFGLALYYTRNREDAKDVVQDAFIKALQNLERFDRDRDFGPWLLSIVRNLSIDLLRKRRFSTSELLTDCLVDPSALSVAERGILRREVWSILQKLHPNHREIILLRDYHGYTYLEIADTLDIPLGTVMSRLHQSRKRFRRAAANRPLTAFQTASSLPN